MTPAEIKLGMPFEKHLEFYKLSDNDSKAYQLEFKALNAQMLKNNNDMTELVKIKKELELKLVTVKEELESNLANIKKEKEFQINALNDQNLKTIDELKTQNFKTTDELKNQNSKITSELRALEQIKNKIETDCKQVQDLINKKQDENVKLQLEIKNLGTVKNDLLSQVGLLSSVKSSADNLIIGLVIVTILCILMTVMYFRK
jgi:chromosome segregation ATPase